VCNSAPQKTFQNIGKGSQTLPKMMTASSLLAAFWCPTSKLGPPMRFHSLPCLKIMPKSQKNKEIFKKSPSKQQKNNPRPIPRDTKPDRTNPETTTTKRNCYSAANAKNQTHQPKCNKTQCACVLFILLFLQNSSRLCSHTSCVQCKLHAICCPGTHAFCNKSSRPCTAVRMILSTRFLESIY
jgi:hypothetical protein